MEKVFEGYVSIDEEYGYMGVNCEDVGDKVDGMVRRYEGRKIKVTVIIEEIKDATDEYDEMYCEECGGTSCIC